MNKFEKKDIKRIAIIFIVVTIICLITGLIVKNVEIECLLKQVNVPPFIPAIFVCLVFVFDTLFKDKMDGEKLTFKKGLIYFGIAYIVTFVISRIVLAITGVFVNEAMDGGSLVLGGIFSFVLMVVSTIYFKLWQYPLISKEYIILLLTSSIASNVFSFIYGKAVIVAIAAIITWTIALAFFFGGSSSKKSDYEIGYQEGLSSLGSYSSLKTSAQRRGYEDAKRKIESDKETRGF